MRVYKDFYDNDMYDLLSKASENGHLRDELINYELSSLLYDFLDETSEDIEEGYIYDFIRFDMEIQTTEELFENYKIECDEDDDKDEIVEEYICSHSAYIGNYEVNDITYHVFTQF
jgi:hypothetical protein